MYKVMESHYGNPSSIHAHGREARTIIEKARKSVAAILNTSPSEIFFTSGGTEADNMAIRCGIVDHKISHAITTKIEHHAVLHTLEAMERSGQIKLSYAEIDSKGNLNVEHLKELLASNERSFVSLMHANNEIGTLTDIEVVGQVCKEHNAIFHCDTVQTMGHYAIDLQTLNVNFITCAAHKFHGPKGVGFLYINGNLKINPMIFGGAQERNMRGGTENLYGIVGLAKALEIAKAELAVQQQYIQGLKSYMIEQLIAAIPGVEFNGEISPEKSLYTVLNVLLPETDIADMLLFNLDIDGISVSGGSACSSGTNIGSHVLEAIGSDPNRPAVRFSFSKLNTKEEIDFVVGKLKNFY
jgi:cysteine desulfurase